MPRFFIKTKSKQPKPEVLDFWWVILSFLMTTWVYVKVVTVSRIIYIFQQIIPGNGRSKFLLSHFESFISLQFKSQKEVKIVIWCYETWNKVLEKIFYAIVYFDSSIQKSAYVVFSIIWILYFHEIDKDLLKYRYCVKSIDYNQCPLIIKADVVFWLYTTCCWWFSCFVCCANIFLIRCCRRKQMIL